MNLPIVDGHFWVERDGKIIDPHFKTYDDICKIRKCEPKIKSYLPAPELTKTMIISMYMKVFKKVFGEKSQSEIFAEVRDITKRQIGLNPRPDCCFQNCMIEIAERGGNLMFGSLGFKYKNNDGYFYEYGGENYKTIKDFIK